MSKTGLDDLKGRAFFEQVCGVGMSQCMDMSGLWNLALFEGFSKPVLNAGDGYGPSRGGFDTATDFFLCRKEPSWIAVRGPELPKKPECGIRQWDSPLLGPFSTMNVDDHSIGVDVTDLQMSRFLKSKPTGIDRGEDGAKT